MIEPTEENPVVLRTRNSYEVYHTRECATLKNNDNKREWYDEMKHKLPDLRECKLCRRVNVRPTGNQKSYAKQIRYNSGEG